MTQSFANHTKIVPPFHFVVLGIFTINLGWSIYRIAHAFSAESVISLLLAIAFILAALYGRLFALTVQDRVIRLEMRLRMMQLLPADLRSRIPEFSVNQLVALRFASDAELPDLVDRAWKENLALVQIKRAVKDWQPDLHRT